MSETNNEDTGLDVTFLGLKLVTGELILGMVVTDPEEEEPEVLQEEESTMDDMMMFIANPITLVKTYNAEGNEIIAMDRWIPHCEGNQVHIAMHTVVATFSPTPKLVNGYMNVLKGIVQNEAELENLDDDYGSPGIISKMVH